MTTLIAGCRLDPRAAHARRSVARSRFV